MSGVHHSSSSLLLHSPAVSLGSPFFFFSSSAFPQLYLWGHHSSSSLLLHSPAISQGFTILLLLFFCIPQLYLWGSPFFFYSSSSAFPSYISGFTILLLFFCIPQLYLWGSPFFFFSSSAFPSYISGVHHSSSSLLLHSPAIPLGFTTLLLILFCVPQLYMWGSPFWVRFLCM